jgi:N6-adenosine-specific RNA methylase IME4
VRGGPFGVILCDPPWFYSNKGNGAGFNGTAHDHYSEMTAYDICALPVADLAAPHSVLILWATWPCLTDAFRVIEAWGFNYVTGLPWIKLQERPWIDLWGEEHIKPSYGTGFWVRGCTEPILICRRGHPKIPTIGACGILAERMEHSRKPDSIYELAEAMDGPYIELFARRARKGWVSWGNEAPQSAEGGAS